MALVESIQIPLNTSVPNFSLPAPNGNTISLDNSLGKNGCIIIFTCNHCPYAIAIWKRIIKLSHWAKNEGVTTIAINPNIHPNYPDDSADNMAKKITKWQIPFPYLVDASQDIARDYKAQCTPDIYLINHTKSLQYHGQFDDNWQNESQVQKQDLKEAIQHLISGKPPLTHQLPSMGCSIKWH